jgi:hypothetical protein
MKILRKWRLTANRRLKRKVGILLLIGVEWKECYELIDYDRNVRNNSAPYKNT